MLINLAAARNKLRQAEILCTQLHSFSDEIARHLRRNVGGDYRLPLETYFSACLNAARSSYFILARTGGRQFKPIDAALRNNVLDQRGRARFNSMLHLRDRDVHWGDVSTQALPKMIEAKEEHESSAYYQTMHYNAALFGPRPM